jgi:predicted amidohydrolase YtcJ
MKLLFNANIHTFDSTNPHAHAILIAGGRIIAVGRNPNLKFLPMAK